LVSWGRLGSKERAADSVNNRLASVLAGVVARGHKLSRTDEEILTAVFGIIGSEESMQDIDFDALKRLFVPAPDPPPPEPGSKRPRWDEDGPEGGGGGDVGGVPMTLPVFSG